MNRLLILAALVRASTVDRVRAGMAQFRDDFARLHRWLRKVGPFYFGSAFAHVLIVGLVLSWTFNKRVMESTEAEPLIDTEIHEQVVDFQLGTPAVLPSELSPETIARFARPQQDAQHFDEQPVFEEAGGGTQSIATQPLFGGLGGFEFADASDGPRVLGEGGVGIGLGGSLRAGNGGALDGLNGAGHGHRDAAEGAQDQDSSDRAVAAALHWFFRHQHADGHWSLSQLYNCSADDACSGTGHVDADAAATALAILPFLAAGQTHAEPGFYQHSVARGIDWLVDHQQTNGDLSGDSNPIMYPQALATLALCEAYSKTRDPRIGSAAQRGIRLIEATQNATTGGWNLQQEDSGDTACTAWHVMALRSAQLGGLQVGPSCLKNAERWLQSVGQGTHGGLVASVPNSLPTVTMTALGLLTRQQLGMPRDEPSVVEALSALAGVLGDESTCGDDLFRSYSIAQALHTHDPMSADWEIWNRNVRRALLATQVKEGCAAGSWYPEQSGEIWTRQGGRLLATSLAVLTLEVSYRAPLEIRSVPWLMVRRPQSAVDASQAEYGKTEWPARH